MCAGATNHRRGVSLIELLVVVAIFAMIAVTVLPNIAATTESRRSREAARMLTSFIAKAQSRALGRREWSGFMLVATNTASSYAAADLFLADVPPVYRGDTVPALLTISGSSINRTRVATGTNSQLLMSGTWVGGAGIRGGDLIRFEGRGPYYEIDSGTTTNAQAVTGTSIRFELRGHDSNLNFGSTNPNDAVNEDGGFQTHNTPWPAVSENVSFEVLRQPVATGSPLALPESRVIDLFWSGYGPPAVGLMSTYTPLRTGTTGDATAGASTSILYDGTGRLRQIQIKLGSGTPRRCTVTGPVFLLLGRADRVGQAYNSAAAGSDDSVGANWQYSDSYWIAIDPFTGVAKAAECMATGTTVIQSQRWIRDLLLTGGN